MKNQPFKAGALAASVVAVLVPSVAGATTNNLCDLARSAVYYFNLAIELIIGLAMVVFVWNVFRYFFTDRENKSERGMYVLWSITGFAVILCFWGLVNVVANTFNFNNAAPTSFGNVFSSGGTGCSSSATQPQSPATLVGTGSNQSPSNTVGTGSTQSPSNTVGTGSTQSPSNTTGSGAGQLFPGANQGVDTPPDQSTQS